MLKPHLFVPRLLLSAALVAVAGSASSSEPYPNKPIRIVTAGAGGGSDFMSRVVSDGLAPALGQPVIVDNRGGGAVIPAQTMAQADPDGYTLYIGASSFAIWPLLHKVPYDPIRDFSPITLLGTAPFILVVHPSVGVNSVKELVALAKAKPGQLNYASGALASPIHLATELFKTTAGVNIVHIPYKGSGPALIDLIAGQVQVMFTTAASVAPLLKSGKLKGLAVTSAEPSPLLPGLPTVAATGVPGYEIVTMYGAYAPGKTPPAIIKRLNEEIVRVIMSPRVKEQFFGAGVEVVGSTPQELSVKLKAEMAQLGKVIKEAGIRVE